MEEPPATVALAARSELFAAARTRRLPGIRLRATRRRTSDALAAASAAFDEALADVPDLDLPDYDSRSRWSTRHWVGVKKPMRHLARRRGVTRRAVALAGWTSHDGHEREAAIEILGTDVENNVRYLAIRSTDWVPEVAAAASAALEGASTDALARHLSLLDALARERSRGAGLTALLTARFSADDGLALLWALLDHPDALRRRAAVRWLEERVPDDVPDLARRMIRDSDIVLRSWAAGLAEALPAADALEIATRLEGDPVGRMRARGFAIRLQHGGVDNDGIQQALFDPARPVRSLAQFHLARRGGDPAAEYRAALASLPAALGLAEVGTADDVPLLRALLDDGDERMRVGAVHGLARIDPDAPAMAERLLDDESTAVSRAALRVLRRGRPAAGLVPLFARRAVADPRPRMRSAMLPLLRRSPWPCLVAILEQLHDGEPEVRAYADIQLDGWLRRSAGIGRGPDDQQRRTIDERLAAVDGARRERIDFVLRTTTPPQ